MVDLSRGLGNAVNGVAGFNELRSIAQVVYGSGKNEGERGGLGSVGILNGRAVKFNTKFMDRFFCKGNSAAKLDASNQMRNKLCEIAEKLCGANSPTLEMVRKDLGLIDGDGNSKVAKTLLSRKVVATVIDKISKSITNENIEKYKAENNEDYSENFAWKDLNSARVKSGSYTDFDSVKYAAFQSIDIFLPGVHTHDVASSKNISSASEVKDKPKVTAESVTQEIKEWFETLFREGLKHIEKDEDREALVKEFVSYMLENCKESIQNITDELTQRNNSFKELLSQKNSASAVRSFSRTVLFSTENVSVGNFFGGIQRALSSQVDKFLRSL